MKLIVLAGAKEGTEIPLKKEKFVIGRSRECTLRAGSDAISRHHCLILRTDDGYTVRDLGSRNGTYVNGERIAAETELRHDDMLRVGPLEFRCEMSTDIDRSKKPKTKDVADVVARSAEKAPGENVDEEDISRWLLGPDPGSSVAMNETRNFRIDETRAIPSKQTIEMVDQSTSDSGVGSPSDSGKGKGDKKAVGKLPPLPPKKTAKDSREAAADILRELGRRR
jgi:pSer/pThr/pTyr-binding forkhead associated (FHA) protein